MCYFSYFHTRQKARGNCLSDFIWHELIFPLAFSLSFRARQKRTPYFEHQPSDVHIFTNQNKNTHFIREAIREKDL